VTILVDDRVGSRHYADLIGNSIALLTRLEYGDAAWDGGGHSIGVEIKKLSDAVSCMYTGRLVDHQLPGMASAYDVRYLVVEGIWRPEPSTGILQYYKGELGKWGRWTDASTGKKRLMYSAFTSWLTTLEMQGGVRVHSTSSAEVTAAWLKASWRWWQSDDHASFHTFHTMTGTGMELVRPGFTRRVAAELPGIGWEKSKAVAEHFGSVERMVSATEKDWQEIDGIGAKLAKDAVSALAGRGK
jgi:ERCC4-type nuclease